MGCKVYLGVKRENVLNQSARLFTLSIANQNTQKIIENEEKISSDQILKGRTHSRLLLLRTATHKNLALPIVIGFFRAD